MKSLLPLLWICILSFIAVQLESPISVASIDTEGFSALNIERHLDVMASEPHFMGTPQNRKVRDYILSEFNKLDIPTEMFIGYSEHRRGDSYVRMGRTENIIATIKGASSGKALLVVGHYDSVQNSPGAADDVHSVGCMLEVARLLRKVEHKNDIIFLITDGEEMGLFGAKSFAETRDLSNIGLVLNYEARGNSGASISFEWSDGNGWLARQLRKAAKRPIASSMSYEIYNRLPNDTDFTYLKKAGLTGINNAFIDGFSYYHNPVDNPDNINMNSVQHTGENMLRLSKHFANIDLSNTAADNASFFNFLGALVIYPASWDLALLAILGLMIVFVIYYSIKNQDVSIKSFLIAFLSLFGAIVFIGALSFGLGISLFKMYPQYGPFYAGQFYNHKWYLISSIGISMLMMWLTFFLFSKRSNLDSIKPAALLLLGLTTISLYIEMPTASYFMALPTMALSIKYLIDLKNKNKNISLGSSYMLIIVPVAIWSPLVPNLFLAFSLKALPGPAILVAFVSIAILVCFSSVWDKSKILLYASVLLIVGSLIGGHLTSHPDKEHPLPSSLFFSYDSDSGQSHWITQDKRLNIGNKEILEGASLLEVHLPNTYKTLAVKSDLKPNIAIPTIFIDSISSGELKIVMANKNFMTRLYLKEKKNISSLLINGHEAITEGSGDGRLTVDLYGMTSDTLSIKMIKKDVDQIVNMGINNKFLSLPKTDKIPDNARRKHGHTEIIQWVIL